MDTEKLRQKLIGLGPEQLSDAILHLASDSDEAAELVKRLVATPKENVKRFKVKLTGLKRARSYVDWRDVGYFAKELEGLLDDLRAGVTDPFVGVELLTAFYKCDRAVFERCDDSSSMLGSVFTFTARDLFVKYAAECPDKDWVAEILLDLYPNDDYGVRAALLTAARDFLPVEALRNIVGLLWGRSKKEKADSHELRHWIFGVESLARQLNDAPLFEKARLAAWPELSPAACQDIAEIYMNTGDADTALAWLERIPKDNRYRTYEQDRLLLAVYEKLGYHSKRSETAWRIFLSSRSLNTLKILLSVIGEDERERVLGEQCKDILAGGGFSVTDTDFLIDIGCTDEAETYLLKHVAQLNGDLYASLLPIAEGIEKQGRWLASYVVYRALLESILQKAVSKYYNHGVRYLKKLDSQATKVSDWRDVQPHEVYKADLLQKHGRKVSFWSKYSAGR